MRELTQTLISAQKSSSQVPYVKVIASDKIHGVVRLDWTRLYTGTEADGVHAAAMPADGSLVRVRVTPVESGQTLFYQRVVSPGAASDFSQWTNTGQYGVLAVACCALNAEVSIFWVDSLRKLQRLYSTDYGATWNNELIDYVPSTTVYGMAAAYKSNGDIAVFFADLNTLYVKKRTGGSWQTSVQWDKTTGDLSGVACFYSGDWTLLVTGKDASDNYKLWSLIYGDGSELTEGSWSALKELAAAPAGGDFEYRNPALGMPDVYRCYYTEKFIGVESYTHSLWSYMLPDTGYSNSLWHEPVPFNFVGDCGLCAVHGGNYAWLSCPYGIWRAPLTVQSMDLTEDTVSIKEELVDGNGKLSIELRNDDGRYTSDGSLPNTGCQIDFSTGFRTAVGNESCSETSFSLEAYELTSGNGKAAVLLYCNDGWSDLKNWTARCQLRWNKDVQEMSVKQMLEFILARAGLRLEVRSQSAAVTGLYPDFTIHVDNSGDTIIGELLAMVPDRLFMEGYRAYLVNPLASDIAEYDYGSEHIIFEGRYRGEALKTNRVQVEGYDATTETAIITESSEWDEICRMHDRLKPVTDSNIGSAAQAQERGQSWLRKAAIAAVSGYIRTPVNCGQQLYDVIGVTDKPAGLESSAKRVTAITLIYNRLKGEYEQKLGLGGV